MDEAESIKIQNQIKNHYLFPVIELLQTKCENVTNNLDDVASFQVEDMFKLIHELKAKTNHDVINGQNKEINQLVFDVIYMLRVHLLELSKLKKLVERFKNKYTAVLKKTISRDSEFHSLSDSDDDNFLDDIYASNFPIAGAGAFFPGPYLPQFPPILDPTLDSQNKNPFLNVFNANEKFFYDQQNNYLLQLAYLANTHSMQPPPSLPPSTTTTSSSQVNTSNNTVNPSSKINK